MATTKKKIKKVPAKKAPAKKTRAAAKAARSPKSMRATQVAKKLAAKKSKPIASKPAARAEKRPIGMPEKLRDAALKILDERQAEEIATFDLAGRSSIADYLIVASGRSGRQLAAIANYLDEAFSQLGVERTRVEGLPEANWVLVDGGDVIIHLFQPDVRRYYNLDGIWKSVGRDT